MAMMSSCRKRTPGFRIWRYGTRTASAVFRPNITSSFEKPNTNASDLSMSAISIASPNASDSIVVNSRPPKPEPSTTTRVFIPDSFQRNSDSVVFALVDVAFDVAELLLDEAGGVTNTLVVDRRPELAHEKVEQSFGPEVAQRVVEL